MVQSTVDRNVEEADEGLARFVTWLTIGWMLIFFLASLGLIFFGDVLMDLFV